MPVARDQTSVHWESNCSSYQVVISSATMMSSLMTKAVKEIDTMFRNSVSNKRRDMIMMAAPINITINLGNLRTKQVD